MGIYYCYVKIRKLKKINGRCVGKYTGKAIVDWACNLTPTIWKYNNTHYENLI
ncbi:hypothetical protein [Clostridium estertheticum]|uniref:hypothetical protein n=1 Tax=Clostridium estertheticum TaxID=238834 RepID=UPI001C6DE583|nr:hypothetical protein [Clostridium estertheticum]MBW9154083.1 hypothetical protein [Clostridium estertheticum]